MANKRIMIEEYASWQKPILSVANEGVATKGNRYIIGAAPTGTFEGLSTHDIAWYDGAAWQTDTPAAGWKLYNADDSTFYTFSGAAWVADEDPADKMDIQEAATEDNLVAFDGDGNAKDSGVATPTFDADLGCIIMGFD